MARPAKTDEKRQELLNKALACFTKYGYTKTTLEDVAKATGINKASLYHYFKNKEELFLQVLLQVSQRGIDELIAKTGKLKSAEKQLIYYFTQRLHFYLQVVRLNSLSKETLLTLQVLFDSVYKPVKEKEIIYIANLLNKIVTNLTKKQALDYAGLLFNAADAIKHSAVFTGELLQQDDAAFLQAQQQITQTISLLLKGIQS
jgi:AcrR family transcriptional regulator